MLIVHDYISGKPEAAEKWLSDFCKTGGSGKLPSKRCVQLQ
jgi:oligoendopeptidase F